MFVGGVCGKVFWCVEGVLEVGSEVGYVVGGVVGC